MAHILLNMHNTVYTQAQTNHKEANILLRMRSLNPDANKSQGGKYFAKNA